jgi:hypothetical protein
MGEESDAALRPHPVGGYSLGFSKADASTTAATRGRLRVEVGSEGRRPRPVDIGPLAEIVTNPGGGGGDGLRAETPHPPLTSASAIKLAFRSRVQAL